MAADVIEHVLVYGYIGFCFERYSAVTTMAPSHQEFPMKRSQQNPAQSVSTKKSSKREKMLNSASLEALETRVLLSGAVLASVSHGSLHIRGDAADDAIVVDQVGLNADQVRIAPANGSVINNQASPVVLSGIRRGVFIQMGSGDDSLTLQDLSLPGNVTIEDSAGSDTIALANTHVAKRIDIRQGAGVSGSTTIADTTVGKGLSIHSRSGGQTVALTSVEVQRNTDITTGRGADTVKVDDSIFHGSMTVNTGRGADSVLIESQGNPTGATTNFDGPVAISLGSGDDVLQLGITGNAGNHSVFARKVTFNSGNGSDTLSNSDAATYLKASRVRVGRFESTNSGPDTTAPTVTSTNPADGDVSIQPNSAITATFSEALAPATVTAANVTLTGPGQAAVAGAVSYAGTTVTFTPTNPLADNTAYTLMIGSAITDTSGNALAATFISTFTTGAAADVTAPTVTATNPSDGQLNVAVNSTAAVIFSEPMDAQTITSVTFTLTGPGGAPVAGTVNYSAFSHYAAFTPSSDLAPGLIYTATILGGVNGVKDLAGNPLATDFVWSFAT
jgi:hypothetical protein